MYLLYLDESGSVGNSNEKFFVLAGITVFERKTHWIEQDLNNVAKRFSDDLHSIELHGAPMRNGKGFWRRVPNQKRTQAMIDALEQGVVQHCQDGVRLFGVVVKKQALVGIDPVQYAFEQLVSRFDLFLKRQHLAYNNTQRGLMLFDKSSTERRLQTLAREFKYTGHAWGTTRNYAEVPVFLDSTASRLIQLADLIAYALWRHYEQEDSRYFDVIKHCFDTEGGVVHGLHERL